MTQRLESVHSAGFGSVFRSGGPGTNTAIVDLLERYAASTAVAPRADLSARIAAAVAAAPEQTPPRRYLWALVARDGRGIAVAVSDMLASVAGSTRARAAVRAQSLAILLVTLLATGALAAAGAGGVLDVMHRFVPDHDLPAVAPPTTLDGLPTASPSSGASTSAGHSQTLDPHANGSSQPKPIDPRATAAPSVDGGLPTAAPTDSGQPGATPADPGMTPGSPHGAPAPGNPTPGSAQGTPMPSIPTPPGADPTPEFTAAPDRTSRPRPTPRANAAPSTEEPNETQPHPTEPVDPRDPDQTDAPRTDRPKETDAPVTDGGGSDAAPSPDDAAVGTPSGGLDLLALLTGWLVW